VRCNICGIAGVIGSSKDPELSFEIISNVFRELEVRGVDAAGFWGANEANEITCYKEPIRSSELVRKKVWKDLIPFNPNLLLLHARQASIGEPRKNVNNHPFTNYDQTLCLIHNGRIPEFNILKKTFHVTSECDSEVLLRIIEACEDQKLEELDADIANRTLGIGDVFSLINHGHMAVALGEIRFRDRRLWLFRNCHRSLYLIDLQDYLGQTFFCSTAGIWEEATSSLVSRQRIIDIPTNEIWYFENNEFKERFEISFGGYEDWDGNGQVYPIHHLEIAPDDDIFFDVNPFVAQTIDKLFSQLDTLISGKSDKNKLINVVRFYVSRLMKNE